MPVPHMTRADFHRTVQLLCVMFDGSETSGWRSTKRNRDVGGSRNSKHLVGYGVDIVLDNMAGDNRHRFCLAARKAGLYVEDEGDHVHVQGLPPGPIA